MRQKIETTSIACKRKDIVSQSIYREGQSDFLFRKFASVHKQLHGNIGACLAESTVCALLLEGQCEALRIVLGTSAKGDISRENEVSIIVLEAHLQLGVSTNRDIAEVDGQWSAGVGAIAGGCGAALSEPYEGIQVKRGTGAWKENHKGE